MAKKTLKLDKDLNLNVKHSDFYLEHTPSEAQHRCMLFTQNEIASQVIPEPESFQYALFFFFYIQSGHFFLLALLTFCFRHLMVSSHYCASCLPHADMNQHQTQKNAADGNSPRFSGGQTQHFTILIVLFFFPQFLQNLCLINTL